MMKSKPEQFRKIIGQGVSDELRQYDDINYQHRGDFVSNREILVNALESTAKTGEEISRLRAYKEDAASLNEDSTRLC